MMAGLSRSTWQYRRRPRPRVAAPVRQKDRAYPSRISSADRADIAARITAGWAERHSADHSFAAGWHEGVMLGSRRSWWRIAAGIEDQSAWPVAPTRVGRGHARGSRDTPGAGSDRAGQVWSWGITDLRTPWRACRSMRTRSATSTLASSSAGGSKNARADDELAVEMFQHALAAHGVPEIAHADSGPAMRSSVLKDFLGGHGITQTHNRPRVSNDNPFSESEFRTMKYRPDYPGTFADIEQARAFMGWYVPWYNQHHKHSGIALFSPDEVHDGSWRSLWQQREQTQERYYQAHPERFRASPRTPAPAGIVGINLPRLDDKSERERLHAA